MTSLTIVTLLLMLYGLRGRLQYARALALGGATAAGAAVSVGGIAVPTFHAIAVGAALVVVHDSVRSSSYRDGINLRRIAGLPLLIAFVGWSIIVTLTAPLIFDGQSIVVPTDPNARLSAGVLTTSNLAQIVYLILAVCVVVFVARTLNAGPELIGIVVGTAIILSSWRYLGEYYGVWFPEKFFDNSDRFVVIETSAEGEDRFRGIFSEPASLAGVAVIAICYSASRLWQVSGLSRFRLVMLTVVSLFLGFVSTSTTFIVAGVAMVVIALITFVVRFFFRGSAVSLLSGITTTLLVVVAIWVVPLVVSYVESQVEDKVGTSSYADRSSADSDAYKVVEDTAGFGVGLGSNRPSSFLAGLIGSTGVLGGILFAAAVSAALVRGAAFARLRPVVWSLVAALLLKTISGPDLSDSSGVLWICLGLLSQARPLTKDHAFLAVHDLKSSRG